MNEFTLNNIANICIVIIGGGYIPQEFFGECNIK